MLRRCWILILLLFAADLQGATISGFAAGFANQTPGFWGIEFQSGAPAERITSVMLKMPGPGFFDFDGVDNYQNQTAPIFDPASSLGLSAGQVFFSFTGEHPKVLRIRFAPDAFAPGDRLQFAADIDGLGSKVGGALGGYGGVQMTVALSDRRTGVANFRTDTEVASRTTVDIAPPAVPEAGSTFWLLLCGVLILCALDFAASERWRRQARSDKDAIARLPLAVPRPLGTDDPTSEIIVFISSDQVLIV